MKYFIIIFSIVLAIGCKQTPKTPANIVVEEDGTETVYQEDVPNACDLVSDKFIANALGLQKGAIEIKDGSTKVSKHSRSCFYKWEDPNVNDAGIMIQAMGNPVKEEAPEYLVLYLESKKTKGETDYNENKQIVFKDFDVVGDDGAYSYEMHRYHWRIGDQRLYTIAFNTHMSEQEEYDIAVKVAKEIMKKG